MTELVCFEVNNWIPGEDYPLCEPFLSWMENDTRLKFHDPNWCKEQKLCVLEVAIDMSISFIITATKEWVELNCPCLLLSEYSKFVYTYPDPYYNEYTLNKPDYEIELRKKFEKNKEAILKDLQPSNLTGYLSDQRFLDYIEENIGLWWWDNEREIRKKYKT